VDAQLRADLGAADVARPRDRLRTDARYRAWRRERAARALEPLVAAKVIDGFDSPASYLPVRRLRKHAAAACPVRRSCATTYGRPRPAWD